MMKLFALTIITLSGIVAIVAVVAICLGCEFNSSVSVGTVKMHITPITR